VLPQQNWPGSPFQTRRVVIPISWALPWIGVSAKISKKEGNLGAKDSTFL
jgi:hypothetical protein